ncbi:MAG: XdhC/CoxI family protein [Actinobacteria bacterium]|nr:XdhC/CoxI family protein [Actinomycetota bacterium]
MFVARAAQHGKGGILMNEVLESIETWRRAGLRVAIAKVVGVEGSAPMGPGAVMAVNENGEVAGSVSGGCVEGAVLEDVLKSMHGSLPAHVRTYGYSDEDAFTVGLTCGGTLHILVTPDLPAVYEGLRDALVASRPVVLATVCRVDPSMVRISTSPGEGEGTAGSAVSSPALIDDGGEHANGDASADGGTLAGATMLVTEGGRLTGSLGDMQLDQAVAGDARDALAGGATSMRHYGIGGERCLHAMEAAAGAGVEVLLESFVPPPRMIILGAVDFTASLARVAKVLGYHVVVCDAREVFATKARFPVADEVVVAWPDRYIDSIVPPLGQRDAICILTHDPKFDIPALVAALRTEVGYIGAMGSRRTHAARLAKLRDSGVTEEALSRIMAPVGLDIGARNPQETAVSICAEIILLRSGGGAVSSLRDTSGPVHGRSMPGGVLRL